ncbi:MAG TPA: AAA family ATPase, partial [Bacillota bacterium]|nr:AAA family ATPase [Bacillota bacterium]
MLNQLQPTYFISTSLIDSILNRAKIYLKAGLPIHLSGPSGTGKTSMALKLAKDLGVPYYMVQGDETFNRNDLIGGTYGFHQKIIEDNFISSVSKVEKIVMPVWVNNPITIACREGATLIYDEFTRARPETNNVLLGIISERVLMTVDQTGKLSLEEVHPDFKCILTSNPVEYVGVNKAQDALEDRLVTIKLPDYDRDTLAQIVLKHAALSYEQALRIVRFIMRIHQKTPFQHSLTRSVI